MARRPKTNITFGYNHIEAGDPRNPKTFRICGAETSEAAKYEVCTQAAGRETNHPGVGRCHLHGGNNPSGPDHPRWKGGKYAHIFKGRLLEHLQHIRADPADPTDLTDELDLLRVMLLFELEAAAGLGSVRADLSRAGLLGGSTADSRDNINYPKQPTEDIPPDDSGAGEAVPDGGGWTLPEANAPTIAHDPSGHSSPPARDPGSNQADEQPPGDSSTIPDHTPTPLSPMPKAYTTRDTTKSPRGDNEYIAQPQFLSSGEVLPSGPIITGEAAERIRNLVMDIADVVNRVVAMRNQTALTRAEMTFISMRMREWIEKFIPAEKQEAALQWLRDEVPMLGGGE